MSVVYSLYDALVSINVPTEKAKAVLDAMERDMFAQLVTRAEFNAEMKLVRHELASRFDLLTKDVQATKDSMGPQIEAKLAAFENRMTVRMGKMMATSLVLTVTILGALQAWH
jgi:hypothetical protein